VSREGKSAKLIIVYVKQGLPVTALDTIVEQVETTAEGISADTLMILTGRETTAASNERLLNLAQLGSTLAETSNSTNSTIVRAGVTKYLYPNALIGILFMLGIVSLLIISMLLMMQVQTPSVFAVDKIDFGKIEK
jgi:hypothetical protein